MSRTQSAFARWPKTNRRMAPHPLVLCCVAMLPGTPTVAQTPPRETGATWTWTGVGMRTDWMDPRNWNCSGPNCPFPLMYPEDTGADVVIPKTRRGAVIQGHRAGGALDMGTLTLKAGARLTIRSPKGVTPDMRTGLRVWGGGVKLEAGAKIEIDGGFLDLRGGGSLDMAAGAKIEFTGSDACLRFTDDDRGMQRSRPEVVLVGVSAERRDAARRLIEGVAFITTGRPAAGDAPAKSRLRMREIDGVFTIDAQPASKRKAAIDTPDDQITPLILCGRSKMGAGQWTVGKRLGDDSSTLVADAVVLGDPCQKLHIFSGTVDANTFWLSCGQVLMDPPGGDTRCENSTRRRGRLCNSGAARRIAPAPPTNTAFHKKCDYTGVRAAVSSRRSACELTCGPG